MTNVIWKVTAVVTLTLALALGGCVISQPDPELPAVDHEAITAESVEALGVISELAVAFQSVAVEAESDAVRREELEEGTDVLPSQETADMMTTADGESCTAFDWDISSPLSLTVTFEECELASGELLDGAASLWIERAGRAGAIGVAFEELLVGESLLDGVIVLSSTGEGGLLQLDVDVKYSDADTDLQLVLTDASLAVTDGVATLNGAAEITTDGVTNAAEAIDLTWGNPDNCYPTSGTLILELPDSPVVTATFHEDEVGPFAMVQVGHLPATEVRLSCPGA